MAAKHIGFPRTVGTVCGVLGTEPASGSSLIKWIWGMIMRKSGILLPVSSLPSRFGIGAFSRQAYEFVDFLEQAGQKLWQILPLGPTGYGDSPYQSFSTFAGNPYFIDLEALVDKGWLTEAEFLEADFGDDEGRVDYEKIYLARFQVLKLAYLKAKGEGIEEKPQFKAFVEENAYWLEDYALYTAVKQAFGGVSWIEWEEDIRLRKPESLALYRERYKEETGFCRFQQYLFAKQWQALKDYANRKGIEIVGDIPIYVAYDSADTWSHPELFMLTENGEPSAVAGCPPDAFSATGQLWGNPLYDWDYHKKTDYDWWMKRIAYCYRLYDVLRIDHFRGFDEYWAVPFGDPTAENGRWEKGPGYDLFDTMKNKLGKRKVIAEDLGFLTDSVIRLVKKTGFPGMKVLQFAFDSREDSDYLPHNYERNCVVYTGTHDNDTTCGWYNSIPAKDRHFAARYLHLPRRRGACWAFIRAALSSVADTAIIPMQDYLELGSEARINTPSTLGGNWEWRMTSQDLTEELALKIRDMVKLYGRL